MTLQELQDALQGVTKEQLQAFLNRGMLLAQRDEIDSQINVIRAGLATAQTQAEAQIQTLTEQRAQLQYQIDHL